MKIYGSFPVRVNYDLTMEEAMEAGKYNLIYNEIVSNDFTFKSKYEGTADIEIIPVCFDRIIWKPDEVIKKFNRQGLRPAEFMELLAFGAKYPDIQRKFLIISVEPVWQDPDGRCYLAGLHGGSVERGLYIRFHTGWNANCRFAAVSKN